MPDSPQPSVSSFPVNADQTFLQSLSEYLFPSSSVHTLPSTGANSLTTKLSSFFHSALLGRCHPLGQIPDCRPNLFRAPSRRSFRLPFGGDSAPPSGQIPDRFPEEFQVVIPDRFQVAGRIPNRHPYEPQLGRTAAPEIAPKSGRHSRRRNVRPQPPYPNKRFSSAANLYPAFSTCASANSYEKMMKSRDSSYESV